ncbi:hypothetical protein GCM10010279_22970 [Streptomyces mutabilis]|nr:hypothetical protein GCM10010279_22970 [Streptomyces mutabilis]
MRRLGADPEDAEVVPLRGLFGRGPTVGRMRHERRRGRQGERAEDGGTALQKTATADERPGTGDRESGG